MSEDLKRLRETTGAGLQDCKKALEESGGDYDAALLTVVRKSDKRMVMRADVITSYIHSYVHLGKIGVMIKFDVKSATTTYLEDFKSFCDIVCVQAAANGNDIMDQIVLGDSITIRQLFEQTNVKFGEDIKIADMVRWEV